MSKKLEQAKTAKMPIHQGFSCFPPVPLSILRSFTLRPGELRPPRPSGDHAVSTSNPSRSALRSGQGAFAAYPRRCAAPVFHVPLDCVPALPSPTERPDHSGQSPPWAGRSAHAAAHGQGTCWQGGRPHSRQDMTPRPQPPGAQGRPRTPLSPDGLRSVGGAGFLLS